MLLSIVISHEPKFEVPKPDGNSHNLPFESMTNIGPKLRDWLTKNAEKTPRQKVGNAASSLDDHKVFRTTPTFLSSSLWNIFFV